MAPVAQLGGQPAQRLAGPTQRRHRIPPRFRVDQLVQRTDQTGVPRFGAPAAPTRGARPAHLQRLRIIELVAPPPDGVRRDAHRISNDPYPTRAQLTGLDTEPNPALPLGQMRFDRVVAAHQRLRDRTHSTDHKVPEAEN